MLSNTLDSGHDQTTNNTDNTMRQIGGRFALQRLMSQTALADIYWTFDQQQGNNPAEHPVLVLMVHPEITRLKGFNDAWRTVMSRPAPPSTAYPNVLAHGAEHNEFWLAIANTQGALLQDTLKDLNKPLSSEAAIDCVEAILHSTSTVQAGSYGFLEPGAVMQDGQQYILLNAPLVKVLQQTNQYSDGSAAQLTLRSAYISPSVAVGDPSVKKDDTFSAACILYHLLRKKPPYANNTLAANANGDLPAQPTQLKRSAWGHLSESLSLRRTLRAENPELLLQQLRTTNKSKAPLALAALAAMGVVAYAGMHLYKKAGEFIPAAGTQQTAQNNSNSSAQQFAQTTSPTSAEARSNNNESAAASKTDTASTNAEKSLAANNNLDPDTGSASVSSTPDNTLTIIDAPDTNAGTQPLPSDEQKQANNHTEGAESVTDAQNTVQNTDTEKQTDSAQKDQAEPESTTLALASLEEPLNNQQNQQAETARQVAQLLENAQQALQKNHIDSTDTENPGTLMVLRQIREQDSQNTQIQALLARVIRRKQSGVDNLIRLNKLDEAQQQITDIDNLMREFIHTHSESLKQQIALEERLENRRETNREARQLIQQAQAAVKRGRLSRLDTRRNHAMTYINRLVRRQPNNREARKLVTQIAQRRQKDFDRAIQRGDMDKASNYLLESRQLVARFNLRKLKRKQTRMDLAYEAELNRIAARRNPPPQPTPTAPNNRPQGGLQVETADGQIIYLEPQNQPPPQQAIAAPVTEEFIIQGQPPVNAPFPATQQPAFNQQPAAVIQQPVPVRQQQPVVHQPTPARQQQPVVRQPAPARQQQSVARQPAPVPQPRQQAIIRPNNPPALQPAPVPVETVDGQIIYMEPVPFNEFPIANNTPVPEAAPLNLPEVQPLPEPIPELIEISPDFIDQGLQGQ